MTPTVVHRYSFSFRDVLGALVDVGDCEKIDIVVVGENLIIDVISPDANATGEDISPEPDESEQPSQEPEKTKPETERKGGALARRAGMMCNEKGFWSFIDARYDQTVSSANEARDWLRNECGVSSRVDLDYNERAAQVFERIDNAYRLWLEGYD